MAGRVCGGAERHGGARGEGAGHVLRHQAQVWCAVVCYSIPTYLISPSPSAQCYCPKCRASTCRVTIFICLFIPFGCALIYFIVSNWLTDMFESAEQARSSLVFL